MFSRLFHQIKPLKMGRLMSLHHKPTSSEAGPTVKPVFRRAMEDGSEQGMEEEDLYRYNRYRWLSNETEKLAMRYRKFNLGGLLDAAIRTAGNGARSCVKVLKCVEGQYNKVFILTMDNDAELVVKIPNPNAGPAFYNTASEVATRHFLCDVLGVPVPRIYASSSDSTNTIGTEYIFEEKAEGKPLGNIWYQWPKEVRREIIQQVVDVEMKLGSLSFLKHGSIYYKSDLESKGLPCEPLSANLVQADSSSKTLDPSMLENFALGPLTDARLWEGEKAMMNLDRGPWNTTADYFAALGSNEIRWAQSYAKPRMNFHRSMELPEVPDDYVSLLKRYTALAPYFVPASAKEALKTLSHPDLHLDNIFVDPDTKRITHIIDWQSTSACEPFLQNGFPQMLAPFNAAVSDGANDADMEGQQTEKEKPPKADELAYYRSLLRAKNPQRWAALNENYLSVRTKPVSIVSGCWAREDLFSFRHSLIDVIAHWDELAPGGTSCPAGFTNEELELHHSEMEIIEGLSAAMHQLQDENIIPLGGMVRREDYEQAQELNKQFKQMFVDLAEDDHQRGLHSKVWPYQDACGDTDL